jgi:hypothetical protein
MTADSTISNQQLESERSDSLDLVPTLVPKLLKNMAEKVLQSCRGVCIEWRFGFAGSTPLVLFLEDGYQ